MSRTNIDLDDSLVGSVMARYGLNTQSAAVDFALRQLVGSTTTASDIRALKGIGWDGNLEQMRQGRNVLTDQ